MIDVPLILNVVCMVANLCLIWRIRKAKATNTLELRVQYLELSLMDIAAWRVPERSGRCHEDGREMTFGEAYGLKGEKEYIKRLAEVSVEKSKELGA